MKFPQPFFAGLVYNAEYGPYYSHCVYHCDYHIILVTKYRKKVFNEGIFAYFRQRLAKLSEHYPLIRIKEVNHDKDHIHLLVSIPPTMQVGKVVGILKQNTARELKQKFPVLKKIYWGTEAVWSEGYFVSTVGVNDAIVRKYIQERGEKDPGQTKFVPD
jgi:putative transposase